MTIARLTCSTAQVSQVFQALRLPTICESPVVGRLRSSVGTSPHCHAATAVKVGTDVLSLLLHWGLQSCGRKLRLLAEFALVELGVSLNFVARRGYTMRWGIASPSSSKARRWVGVGSGQLIEADLGARHHVGVAGER